MSIIDFLPSKKEQIEEGYEILSFIDSNKIIYQKANGSYFKLFDDLNAFTHLKEMIEILKNGSIAINSVKRLSDKRVFILEDRNYAVKHDFSFGKMVKEIRLNDANDIVIIYDGLENIPIVIPDKKVSKWQTVNTSTSENVEALHYGYSKDYDQVMGKNKKESVVLLTTNEGVKVFNPENIIYILHKDFSKGKCKAGEISKNQNNIYFWSEESLNDYIIQNKPVPVTAIELAKAISFTSDQLNQLVDFFKVKNK